MLSSLSKHKKPIRRAILSSFNQKTTVRKTIMTSLSPWESSISIPYTLRFQEIFQWRMFFVHCRLGSIFPATSGKTKTKSWWWRASTPWICLRCLETTKKYSPKGRLSVIYYDGTFKKNPPVDPSVNVCRHEETPKRERKVSSNSPGHTCMSCSMSGILGHRVFANKNNSNPLGIRWVQKSRVYMYVCYECIIRN